MAAPELAFLHIPKTGGTSLHRSLIRYYGEQALFWFGKDCPADIRTFPGPQLAGRPVVGGHKPLRFYPAALDPLYCAVLREPVARAISLFAYYTQPELAESARERRTRAEHLARLRRKGMDPESMSRSIRHCRSFRREISNFQCSYLSRGSFSRLRPGFDGVMQSLSGCDFLLGTQGDYTAFHRALGSLLGWPPEAPEASNRSRDNYAERYLQDRELVDLVRELNREDERLLAFVERAHGGLWLRLRDPLRRNRLRALPLKSWLRGGDDWDWEAAGRELWSDSSPSRLPWPLPNLLVSERHHLLYPPIPGPTDAWVHRLMLSLSDIPHREAVDDLGMGGVLARFRTGLLLRDHALEEAKAIIADPRYFRFAVVQEPVRRLEDVYLEWFVARRRELLRWPRLADTVAAAQGRERPDLERGISFRQFVAVALSEPPLQQFVLWLGQHLFLRGIQHWDRLYRPDQLEALHRDLMARTGLDLPMPPPPQYTAPAGTAVPGQGAAADRLPGELAAREPGARPALADAGLRQRILDYYREDHDLYNGIDADMGAPGRA